MRMVRLDGYGGRRGAWVNPEAVDSVDEGQGPTKVHLRGGHYVETSMSVDDVVDKLVPICDEHL